MFEKPKKKWTGVALILLLVVVTFAGCIGQEEEPPATVTKTLVTTEAGKEITKTVVTTQPPPPEANVVEIYHWWTSGGEKAAIDALVAVFNSKYPDTAVIQSPVAGGAGYVMKAVLKSLVLAGEAPDAASSEPLVLHHRISFGWG